jgi:hypothetical protein
LSASGRSSERRRRICYALGGRERQLWLPRGFFA